MSFLPKKSQICLIQISTKDYSWILDIIELKKCKMFEKCITLLKAFYENSKINKLCNLLTHTVVNYFNKKFFVNKSAYLKEYKIKIT